LNLKDVNNGQIQNVFGPWIWNVVVKKTGGVKSGTVYLWRCSINIRIIPSLIPLVPLINHLTYLEIWQQIPRHI
jgi:hypothetical protein